jgi:hypothetical protein
MSARIYNIATERAKRRPAVTALDFYFRLWMFWLGAVR